MIFAVFFLDIFSDDSQIGSDLPKVSSSLPENVVTGTTEPSSEEVTEDYDSLMFDLKGKYFEITKEKYKEYFTLEAVYEFNDEYEKDQIIDQDIKSGEPFKKGQKITVKVSKGKTISDIPDYSGLTISQYETKLKQAGISNYSLVPQQTSTYGSPNTVLQLVVNGKTAKPGDKFDNSKNDALVVYYLPEDAVIITEPPATEPPTEPPTEAPVVTDAPVEVQPATEAPQESAPVPEQNVDVQ